MITLQRKSLLIVDDQRNLCKSLICNFNRYDYTCYYALDKTTALNLFSSEDLGAVILDVRLGEESGLQILRQFQALDPTIPVIILTGYATISDAVESVKNGAKDYIQKPANFNQLLSLVERVIAERPLDREPGSQKPGLTTFAEKMVTNDPRMLEVYARARRLANSSLCVLIFGESGTGKELLAEFIHSVSPRSSGQLVKVNCASFPDSLLDNELFGHEKGSFTGADSIYQGVFEQAQGGTLFLDEVSDMTLATQAKILRALQNQEIRRIGGRNPVRLDVRFVGATNRDIRSMVASGTFRQDLFYRLNAALLEIPPLRDRKEDIPGLCDHFLKEFAQGNGSQRKTLSDSVRDLLMEYDWPGNIRELRNAIHYAFTIALTSVVHAEDLPPSFLHRVSGPDGRATSVMTEKDRINEMLRRTGFNKSKAAELLNISRKTLYNKIDKYGLSSSG
ncbi:MAG: sigma-54 dependent transcriptional regulator [Spirochaetia bacterium]